MASSLINLGINTAYAVTGGAVVHILDSYKNNGGKIIFFHHEQSASFAVSSHYKTSGNIACCMVTSGPGVTNAITGLASAWLDSIPAIFISGQSRLNSLVGDREGMRQSGNQEVITKDFVEGACKKFFMPRKADDLESILHEAIELTKNGRPGPVWIDIPLDIQWSEIDKPVIINNSKLHNIDNKKLDLSRLKTDLIKSKKPIFLLGAGIKTFNAEKELDKLLSAVNIPVLTTWGAIGLIDEEDKLYCGRPGPAGQRGANKILLESDLIISIGSHMRSQVIGPTGVKDLSQTLIYVIHVDPDEDKYSNLIKRNFIFSDAKLFIDSFLKELEKEEIINRENWLNLSKNYHYLDSSKEKINDLEDRVDPYKLIEYISKTFKGMCNYVVDGGGTVTAMCMQALKVAKGQNIVLSSALTPMGTGLPESVGSACASEIPVITFIGEGSFQFNIQELATIKYHNYKVFVILIDNGGYLSIKNTIGQFLEGRNLGVGIDSGLCFPNAEYIAKAYGFEYLKITSNNKLFKIKEAFLKSIPTIIEIKSNPNRKVEPRIAFRYSEELNRNISLPLSNMDP